MSLNDTRNTVRPVLSNQSDGRINKAFRGRWLHYISQFAVKYLTAQNIVMLKLMGA